MLSNKEPQKEPEKETQKEVKKETKVNQTGDQKGNQKSLVGRLWVYKRLHGTQGADMRQTLAGVCQNNIREVPRHPQNIKQPPQDHLFRNAKKNNHKYTKKCPK